MNDGAVVITNPNAIQHFHYLAQLGAMKLELKGLKHSSGRSVIAYVKKQHGFKGNKQSVVDQFAAWIGRNTPEPRV